MFSFISNIIKEQTQKRQEKLEKQKRQEKLKKQKQKLNYQLQKACKIGSLDIVKILINNGAEINQYNSKNSNRYQPLIYASESGNLNLVKYLVENGANVNIKNKEWFHPNKEWIIYTPLYVAYKMNNYKIVEYLLEKGAKPVLDYDTSTELGKKIENIKLLQEISLNKNQ